ACWSQSLSTAPSPVCPERSVRTGASRDSLELLRYPEIEDAARSELRREHADAGTVPDLVDRIEKVDDVEAQRGAFCRGHPVEIVKHADVDLRAGRQRGGVGEAVTQAAAVDHV